MIVSYIYFLFSYISLYCTAWAYSILLLRSCEESLYVQDLCKKWFFTLINHIKEYLKGIPKIVNENCTFMFCSCCADLFLSAKNRFHWRIFLLTQKGVMRKNGKNHKGNGKETRFFLVCFLN
jgi:hypothetical protein